MTEPEKQKARTETGMINAYDMFSKFPKAELHLHIEGTFEPSLMFEIAGRNGVDLPYADVEALRKAYNFSKLQDFLDIYYQGMRVLLLEQDFYDLTWAYLNRVHADNVCHVEIFFDPQAHTERGVAFRTVITGIHKALEDGKANLGMSYKLIMSFLRHLSEENAFECLEQAKPYLTWIDGIGLDSSEIGNPPEKFERVYMTCRDLSLKLVAHAGEECPAEYVWNALNRLKVDRLDHGNRSLDDAELVAYLVREKLPLTVCPLSNLKLCVVTDMKDHPIRTMLEKGLLVSVNSDDPAYFGGYVNDNFKAVYDALDLTVEEAATLAKNSFIGSFLSEEDIQVWLARIEDMRCAYLSSMHLQ